jgi:hypothetical protein
MHDTQLDKRCQRPGQTASPAPFNGALKSKNEIYFQIASVFTAASRDETRLANAWMHRILMSSLPENTGKMFLNGL